MTYNWKKFPHRVYWIAPGKVEGTITSIVDFENVDGQGATIELVAPDGIRCIVNATQARLLSELVVRDPQVGDKIRIVYHGEAKKAARGMSPAKEFSVEVWPQKGSRAGERTAGELGEVPADNATRPGTKAK